MNGIQATFKNYYLQSAAIEKNRDEIGEKTCAHSLSLFREHLRICLENPAVWVAEEKMDTFYLNFCIWGPFEQVHLDKIVGYAEGFGFTACDFRLGAGQLTFRVEYKVK